jgi:hypothetical protein
LFAFWITAASELDVPSRSFYGMGFAGGSGEPMGFPGRGDGSGLAKNLMNMKMDMVMDTDMDLDMNGLAPAIEDDSGRFWLSESVLLLLSSI